MELKGKVTIYAEQEIPDDVWNIKEELICISKQN